jgi:hypothetical protein
VHLNASLKRKNIYLRYLESYPLKAFYMLLQHIQQKQIAEGLKWALVRSIPPRSPHMVKNIPTTQSQLNSKQNERETEIYFAQHHTITTIIVKEKEESSKESHCILYK